MYIEHKNLSVDSLLLSDINRLFFKVDTTKVIDTDTIVVDIDGNVYHTVKIGTQTWMVENLKTTKYRNGDPIPNVNGGTAWGNLTSDAYCNYNKDTSNANLYGRLYNWYAVNDSRQIAPTGWHVATDEEWAILTNYSGGESSAGNKLKSKTGWNDNAGTSGNGTDEYGFTALPGGARWQEGTFGAIIGKSGYWWTSKQFGTNNSWYSIINYDNSNVSFNHTHKKNGFSVRCVKGPERKTNTPPSEPFSPNPSNGQSGVSTNMEFSWSCSDAENDSLHYDFYLGINATPTLVASGLTSPSYKAAILNENLIFNWKVVAKDNYGGVKEGPIWSFQTESVNNDTVTDIDGNVYHTIRIGTQVWMVENLRTTRYRNGDAIPNVTENTKWRLLTNGAYCNYNNDTNHVNMYGRMYNWYAVNDIRKIAPPGWRVASDSEWLTLIKVTGGTSAAGKMLKSKTGWNSFNEVSGNGSDEFGFTTLPGGNRYNGAFSGMGNLGSWWTTNYSNSSSSWFYRLQYNTNLVERGIQTKETGFSVRCIKDLGLNSPPAKPDKLIPVNLQPGVQLTQNFSWSCYDDEQDTLYYDLYLGINSLPNILVVSDITQTNYTVYNMLAHTEYYWKVVAKDNKGGITSSDIQYFKTQSLNNETVTDNDGNLYHTVTIGTQTWLAENLKTTRYRNGDPIPNITDGTTWSKLNSGAYCNYNNVQINGTTYGRLYNWSGVNESRKIAPKGWHIASDAEWKTLTTYLGESKAAERLKTGGDYSFFNVLMTYSRDADGLFSSQYGSKWWSSTEFDDEYKWGISIFPAYNYLIRDNYKKENGFLVRCVKDSGEVKNTQPSTPTLLNPTNGLIRVSMNSQFSWSCYDTDGDSLYYDFYWGENNSLSLVASGLTNKIYIANKLLPSTQYYWKVVAKDEKGGITESPLWSFKTESENEEIVTDIDGNIYHTVTIGTQTWLAENLKTTKYRNGDPIPKITDGTAWSNTTSGAYCDYNNDVKNGATYGRLYNWSGANESRMIAPKGWHVPTESEWATLTSFVGTDAGKKLKSETGWFDYNSFSSSGNDDVGFTGLPGGYRDAFGNFKNLGYDGIWWSSTKTNSDNARFRKISYDSLDVFQSSTDMKRGQSVRCIKDSYPLPNTLPSTPYLKNPSKGSKWNLLNPQFSWSCIDVDGDSLYYDLYLGLTASPTLVASDIPAPNFTITNLLADTTYYWKVVAKDKKGGVSESPVWNFITKPEGSDVVYDIDGNLYHTVKIGNQVWMAENLRTTRYRNGDSIPYIPNSGDWKALTTKGYSYAYNDTSYIAKYGMLYNWYAINSSNKIAPTGWHIPTEEEWATLINNTGGPAVAGAKLKSESGWNIYKNSGNGTNEYYFGALPGGSRKFDGTFDGYYGYYGFWWTLTETSSTYALREIMYYSYETVTKESVDKRTGFSVRCVKD